MRRLVSVDDNTRPRSIARGSGGRSPTYAHSSVGIEMAGDSLFQRLLELRARFPSELTVDDAMHALNLAERVEVVGLLQRAGKRGYGRFVVGRGSNKTRVVWKSSEAPDRQRASATEESVAIRPSLEHVFPLKEFNVQLTLPRDLTSLEAERISRFVASLATDAS